MTTRPYELLARLNPDGTVAGVSVKTLTAINGRDYEGNPEPLSGTDDPAYAQFAADFSAAVVAERDALVAQVAALTTERDEALAANAPLAAEVARLTADLDTLRNPPFNPRQLSPYAFMQRYTLDERIAILVAAKTDVTVELILAELQTVQRVRLDVEATQNGVGYLQQIGIINAERAAAILADATADEQ